MEKSNFNPSQVDVTTTQSYTFTFVSPKRTDEVFSLLLDVEKWWSGFYNETISGNTNQLNDVFIFKAGGGAHQSQQQLIELIPNKRVVWLVTDSNLAFLDDPQEWNNTKISFDLVAQGDKTTITFTHEGLSPQLECYGSCSNAWTAYLEKLKDALN